MLTGRTQTPVEGDGVLNRVLTFFFLAAINLEEDASNENSYKRAVGILAWMIKWPFIFLIVQALSIIIKFDSQTAYIICTLLAYGAVQWAAHALFQLHSRLLNLLRTRQIRAKAEAVFARSKAMGYTLAVAAIFTAVFWLMLFVIILPIYVFSK